MTHYYAWVRVGNGQPEPAAITGEKPNRKATTIGCPDTFDIDVSDPACVIVLVVGENYRPREKAFDRVGKERDHDLNGRAREAKIKDPLSPDHYPQHYEVTPGEAKRREKAYRAAIKVQPHSYAGFGRKEAGQ